MKSRVTNRVRLVWVFIAPYNNSLLVKTKRPLGLYRHSLAPSESLNLNRILEVKMKTEIIVSRTFNNITSVNQDQVETLIRGFDPKMALFVHYHLILVVLVGFFHGM